MKKDFMLVDHLELNSVVLGPNAGELLMDSRKRGGNPSLVTTLDATHSGVLINKRVYPSASMSAGIPSWTLPYPKPILNKHPEFSMFGGGTESNPIGRVNDAQFIPFVDEEALKTDWRAPEPRGSKGSGVTRLKGSITDEESQDMVLDGRMLTVSKGARAKQLICSACSHDWMMDGPCEHEPGTVCTVKQGKKKIKVNAFLITGTLDNDHLAFVNTPADSIAGVTSASFVDSLGQGLFIDQEMPTGNFSSVMLIDTHGATELINDEEIVPQYRATIIDLPIDFNNLKDNTKATEKDEMGKKDSSKKSEIEDKKKEDKAKIEDEDESLKEDEKLDEKSDEVSEEDKKDEDTKEDDKKDDVEDKETKSKDDIITDCLTDTIAKQELEIETLKSKNKELNDSINLSQEDLADFQEKRHNQSAESLIDFQMMTGKVTFEDNDARQASVDEMAKRSFDSLSDSLEDIRKEFISKNRETNDDVDDKVEDKDDEKDKVEDSKLEPDSSIKDDDSSEKDKNIVDKEKIPVKQESVKDKFRKFRINK